ncbi:hypothetical protein OH77DRAFT_1460594 [Trametes cingulata]|nr:hypothetical protein OH77DRAFT_1460594 [Trametes cingulata]
MRSYIAGNLPVRGAHLRPIAPARYQPRPLTRMSVQLTDLSRHQSAFESAEDVPSPRNWGLYAPSDDKVHVQGLLDEEKAVGSYEAWSQCADIILERDGGLIRAWADQADGLVTFAALFSAVVTSFLIESYTALQPDPQKTIVDLLHRISLQLAGTSLSTLEMQAVPFEPAFADVVRNSLLFASLVCSLVAAGMGVFFKEWLREYMLDMPKDPRELVRVREFRYHGLRRWYMRAFLGGISIFLQLGVALFVCAIVSTVWSLHPILRIVIGVFVGLWVAFWVGAALCPTFSSSCPFRSPLSRVVFAVITLGKRLARRMRRSKATSGPMGDVPILLTFEDVEKGEVERRADVLEADALKYAFTTNRGDKRLLSLNRCISELPLERANTLISELLGSDIGTTLERDDDAAHARVVYNEDVARLEALRAQLKERRCKQDLGREEQH